ncbi:MAG TPA: T9SS type A sorting domain-containing protein [Hanamia sp.]|nr:T9SS type A sorting domain-containing protein [Hanamia sp.]
MKRIFAFFISIVLSNAVSAQSDSIYFPVRLESFDVGVSNNVARLNWKTICYLQYANFQVQKSADGKDFVTIDSFIADKLRCQQPFEYKDSTSINQGNIFYRINVGNIDGKFYNSVIRRLFLKEKEFDLLDVYPTMVNLSLNFSISDDQNETFSVAIINQNGSILQKKKLQAIKGATSFNLKMDNLSTGYYWLKVFNERGKMKTVKFFKQ